MNEAWWKLDSTEAIFLVGAVALTIPMIWLFMRAARELRAEPPRPVTDQRKED